MRFQFIISFFAFTLVLGQATYPNLAVPFLLTDVPTTPLLAGFPWGTRTANNTNPYPPNTGVIRTYDFTIAPATIAPDGYSKSALLINGQYPGPLIEANWGDTIQVTLHNNLPDEGTSLHWHGILQKTSQWMDGVPGISQCPIPPGGNFTYSFTADLYGTSWYHSHYSAQYAGGLIGPMVIHGPETVPYDIDLGPVILTDLYHPDYYSIVENVMGTDPLTFVASSDNNLINGRNNFDCLTVAVGDTTPCVSNAGLSNFQFTSGAVHRLRLINAGAEGVQKFTIDGHTMTVIANDFVPIEPYDTQVVTLGVGQRTDVLVTGLAAGSSLLNLSGDSYLMRSSIATFPCAVSKSGDSTAIVYYGDDAPSNPPLLSVPSIDWTASRLAECNNDDLTTTVPWYPITPDPDPPTTQTIEVALTRNSTGHFLFLMNGVSFRTNYNSPILMLSNQGMNYYPDDPQWNVYNFGANSSIRIVITNEINDLGILTHPIHLHGHNFHVLSEGIGEWDGTVVNPNNTQRRDVQLLRAGGYLALQITADNPGSWPLHCHIAWHVSGGLYVTVLERPDDIAALEIPMIMAQTCRDWWAYTNSTVVDMIDSGL